MIISFFNLFKYRKKIGRTCVLVFYFPILMLKIGEKINEFFPLFIKKAKDLDFHSNAKNREENLFIKKGEGSRFLFPIF